MDLAKYVGQILHDDDLHVHRGHHDHRDHLFSYVRDHHGRRDHLFTYDRDHHGRRDHHDRQKCFSL